MKTPKSHRPTKPAPLALACCALLPFANPAWSQETRTVTVAGFGGGDTVVVNGLIGDAMADEIAAAGIEVEYTPIDGDFSQFLLNALSAGTAPDLYYVDIFWSDAVFGTGQADPVRDQSIAGELLANLAAAFTRDGVLMGIPKDFNSLSVNYNVDAFEDAGVEPPDADDDWESFEAKLASVADELGDIAGVCLVPDYARFGPFALAAGWQPFDADGRTVLDERFRRAFEFYTGMADSGAGVVAADVGEGWMGGCMSSEKAAVALEGAWMIAHLRDAAPSMLWSSTRMPRDPETGDRGKRRGSRSRAARRSTTARGCPGTPSRRSPRATRSRARATRRSRRTTSASTAAPGWSRSTARSTPCCSGSRTRTRRSARRRTSSTGSPDTAAREGRI